MRRSVRARVRSADAEATSARSLVGGDDHSHLRLLFCHTRNGVLREFLFGRWRSMATEYRYRVWFDGERSARSRSFTDADGAHDWAIANQPDRGYKVVAEPVGGLRRLLWRARGARVTAECPIAFVRLV